MQAELIEQRDGLMKLHRQPHDHGLCPRSTVEALASRLLGKRPWKSARKGHRGERSNPSSGSCTYGRGPRDALTCASWAASACSSAQGSRITESSERIALV